MSDRSGSTGGLRRRILQALVALAGAAVAWTAGLVWFGGQIPRDVAEPTERTDAIVVLTGGSERLRTGLELLARTRAKKLFVSGVSPGVGIGEILRAVNAGSERAECCIVLGHAADNTIGNARETAAWMKREGYRSLRLVTAAYHMPRSLLVFRRAMPEVRVVPHPVFPANVKQEEWWRWPGTASLIVSEYTKYLFAFVQGAVAGPTAAGAAR